MRSGHLLNERYEIKNKIGAGGMADVFLARDTILERDVAVKALRMEYANDQEFIARFDREAQSATSLSHENIVSIYDVGEEDHLLYMVMEYVDGMTLKEYIQRFGPVDVTETLDIMKQITSAIAHAHANDIVHRDIKPQNILVDNFGKVKVTDFGIAIALSATALTQTNSILGSVHYLSPEQARGGMATKKSDIYSLGIVMFEMLTGRLPFSGQSPVSIALKHLQSDTPSVRRFNPDIPQSVENIVLKATTKDPFHRYETIYDLEMAVETALNPDKINEAPYTPPVEVGDETKAIPIITDDQIQGNINEETIIHTNSLTKNHPEEAPKKHKKKVDKKVKQKKKAKQKKKRKKWPIFLFIFVLLIGAIALFFVPGLLQPKEVEVPKVIEMESDEARDLLESLNLIVEDEMVTSEDIDEGHIVKTSPSAGRIVNEGSTVTLFISSGKEKVTFEDYVGKDYSQVKRELEIAGFEDFIPYEEYSNLPVGEIITQIFPSPDSEVVPSDTTVRFEVSLGPEPVNLSNLTGLTETEARKELEDNNLQMNKIESNSDTVEPGYVISQDPSKGTSLQHGDTVDVYISTGPEPKPPKTVSITVPIEYSPSQSEDDDSESEGEDPAEKVVRIYIGDTDHNISDLYEDKVITDDEEVSFTLTIAPDSSAEYKVMLEDQLIKEEKVNYEDGE
ncbi:Stk1 family PASTA domain-containing Ser/Thr kinase [Oceanobacillus sp. Castelsardo]|uniref:Stk1 family PASTA domain-containing Ser/Thr kinase n=1 Tax=Oceanobacillus sp. Castelsardo TaxID=1851204 RepID=UPI000837C340|nr:Stk1 family PASTA domain-containing Ser/Thr kinase [Oceanobacillus sp. Castelsardo]